MKSFFINEIFSSISGEVGGFPQGAPCTFVRFSGCNLRCSFCDAAGTQEIDPLAPMSVTDIISKINDCGNRNVVLTGGEPLMQKQSRLEILVKYLRETGHTISIETNGTKRVPKSILKDCTIVMDYKMNYLDKMDITNFIDLKPVDYIKFIIVNQIGMQMAMNIQTQLVDLECQAIFAYSPMIDSTDHIAYEIQKKTDIILKGLKDKGLYGILNLQIHKIINQP